MTTLDQYTPEERAGMVGMWATNLAYTGDGENVGVIACVQHDHVWLIHTHIHGEWSVLSANKVSPRPDLPRAWEPDGTPPEGEWLTHGTHTRVIPKNRRSYVTMSELGPSLD